MIPLYPNRGPIITQQKCRNIIEHHNKILFPLNCLQGKEYKAISCYCSASVFIFTATNPKNQFKTTMTLFFLHLGVVIYH